MNETSPPPTLCQKRLVDIAFVIQFYLAALGHLVVWCYLSLVSCHSGIDAIVVVYIIYLGIPISLVVLVAVYILFRCLLDYLPFPTAMVSMIVLNVLHGLVMSCIVITPFRLLIPTILYAMAFCTYGTDPKHGPFPGDDENKPTPEPES